MSREEISLLIKLLNKLEKNPPEALMAELNSIADIEVEAISIAIDCYGEDDSETVGNLSALLARML